VQTTQEQAVPSGFWETRTGWSRLKQLLLLEPLPGGARWSAAFGSLLLFVFVLQIITGILLATYYAPSTQTVRTNQTVWASEKDLPEEIPTAWASVKYIQEEVPLGDFIRGLHHWGSSAMVVLLLFHLMQVFVWGAYKKPRELTWMVGVLLLVCILGLAFTGYLLPWDQKAYWATKVGLGIASTTPVIGDGLRTLLQGGPEMGNLTLTRFFTLHAFILPGLVIFLIVLHLYLFRLHGVTPSWWQSEAQLKVKEEPFWPKQALKDGLLALAFLVGLGLWVYYSPAPLEDPADPAKPYQARPEWYFMFLFQLLRYFEGPYEIVGTFILPTAFFLILLFWPFLDRNPQRNPGKRPVAMTLLGGATVALVGLTIFAIANDVRMQEPAQVAAQKPKAAEAAGPIQRAEVAKLFNTQCAMCHGVDGTGKQIRGAGMPTIPDFTSMAWQQSQTELEIAHQIQDGKVPLMPAYRDTLTERQIIALVIYVRAFSNVLTETVPPKPLPPPSAAHLSAERLYTDRCLLCHDADGRGNKIRKGMPNIPDFTSPSWHREHKADAELITAILEGKKPFMLPLKDQLDRADAQRLVGLVRKFRDGKFVVKVEEKPVVPPVGTEPEVVPGRKKRNGKRPPVTEAAESAAQRQVATSLYRKYCLECHGNNGKGLERRPSMPTIPDFNSRPWQDGVSDPQLKVSILDGKGTLMPAFADRVTDDQAKALVAYVRAFGPRRPKPPEGEEPSSDFEKRFQEILDQWQEWQRQLKCLAEEERPAVPRLWPDRRPIAQPGRDGQACYSRLVLGLFVTILLFLPRFWGCFLRLPLRAQFGDRLPEEEPCRRWFHRWIGWRHIMPTPQPGDQFGRFFSGQISADAHVDRDIPIIGKRTFGQGPGVVAGATVRREDSMALEGIFITTVSLGFLPGRGDSQGGGTLGPFGSVNGGVVTAPRQEQPSDGRQGNSPPQVADGCCRHDPFLSPGRIGCRPGTQPPIRNPRPPGPGKRHHVI
jgi:ubiquinol-cytochrome c reductase cytochrome b subunit